MKKLLIIILFISNAALAQKMVQNGVIYKRHPNIETMKKIVALYEKGDANGMAKFFADTARFLGMGRYNNPGTAMKGKSLAEAIDGWRQVIEGWQNIKMTAASEPDGLQYANAPFTVQSWWRLTMINKKTKKPAVIDMVLFDMFDKQGKIVSQIQYYDPTPLLTAMK